MPTIINWKKYNTIEESISLWEKNINKRADKIFIKAKKNRIKKEKENNDIEKLFIKWNLTFNKVNQYV